MPVRIEYGLSEDRKPELNGDVCKARNYIPHILRINFIDDRTNQVLFTFVPKLEDEETLKKAFDILKVYDQKRMDLYQFIVDHELKEVRK